MKAHDLIECEVDHYSRQGVASGDLAGWAVEVSGAFAGEQVRGRIAHVGKQSKRLFINRAELLVPHPERRTAPCSNHGRCDGCSWMQLSEQAQRHHKQTLLLAGTFGIAVDQLVQQAGGSREYRWSSKRVVGGTAGRLTFGSYRRGSHELADMAGCLVDHPHITACLDELLQHANRLGIEPYDEAQKTGELRYLWLKTNGVGQVLLTLVCARASDAAVELAQALSAATGVYRSIQAGAGNALRGNQLQHLCGIETLAISLCGASAAIGPLGFLQPNPHMAERCYVHLLDGLSGRVAYDLYAGPGLTSAMLARHFEQVLACDTVIEASGAAPVEQCSTADFLDRALAGELSPPDAIICNPPRAGLGEQVCRQLTALCEIRPFQLRIMSCDPASFARDRDWLASHFQLTSTRAFDTLPQTPHVELVGHFAPRSAQ